MPSAHKLSQGSSQDKIIQRASQEILSGIGKTFIYPTETVYGLGAVYSDTAALKRVFSLKGRDESRPVLLLIPHAGWLSKLTRGEPSPKALELAQRFWPVLPPVPPLVPEPPPLSLAG